MSNKVTIDIGTEWEQILSPRSTDRTLYAVGTSVAIYQSPTEVSDFNDISERDIRYIGGIKATLGLEKANYVYAKANSPGKIFHVPKGMGDPDRDLSAVSELISTVSNLLQSHINEKGNVHDITKEMLEIDNLPNAISNDPTTDDEQVLPTTSATHQILSALLSHQNNSNNPHAVSKKQVGLELVSNFGIALNEEQLLDADRDDLYATIKNIHDLITLREQATSNIKPNTIVEVSQKDQYPSDIGLVDPETETIIYDDDNVICPPGLVVSYSRENRWYLSHKTTEAFSISKDTISPSVDPQEGYHYFYVDIDSSSNIVTFGHTRHRPYFGKVSINIDGDFFDLGNKIMYNKDGNVVTRVYIGKLYVESDGTYSDPIPVPKGNSVIYKPNVNVVHNTTYIFDNPFFENVDVIPKIQIDDQWCDPKWDDQIGVSAIYDSQRPDNIIVQTGKLGLAMSPKSAGNAFLDDNVSSTYSSPSPILLEIYKKDI